VKLCKDCKWCKNTNKRRAYFECHHPNNRSERIDLVDGEVIKVSQVTYCDNQRLRDWLQCRTTHTCGKEGRWWEAKDE